VAAFCKTNTDPGGGRKWRSGGLYSRGGGRVRLSCRRRSGVRSRTPNPSDHLDNGRIDGLISALAPSCFGRNPTVQRLFPDYRAAEEAYFERTRMFPIMHVVGIRRSLLEKHPWLAVNTYVAYQKAKEICYRQLETIGHLFTTLPWPVEGLARARALMGDDFWSYGVEGNQRELAAVSRYAVEQGIIDRQLSPEELFAPSTLSLSKI
jgi:4,5-dihydroxyphthalate decarboxylase